jgi:hypothetical protein
MTTPDALLLCPGYARVRLRLVEYNALMSATGGRVKALARTWRIEARKHADGWMVVWLEREG